MIRGSSLRGRAVVDLDAAEKLGTVEELILDPDSRRVVGLVVSRGATLLGGGERVVVPAGAVHALGADAVTVRRAAIGDAAAQLSGFPRLGDVTGRKVVTHGGSLLGTIADVLVDPQTGQLVGYPLGGGGGGGLSELFGGRPSADQTEDYLRADAELRVGSELVIAPDDAVVRWGTGSPRADAPAPAGPTDGTVRWTEGVGAARPSAWTPARSSGAPPVRRDGTLLSDPHMGLGDPIPPRRAETVPVAPAAEPLDATQPLTPLDATQPIPRVPRQG